MAPIELTDEQRDALVRSAVHWLENSRLEEEPERRKFGEDDCVCCRLWLNGRYGESCTGCPIRQFTGLPGCEGTPYDDKDINAAASLEAFKKASEREYLFLLALLSNRRDVAEKLCAPYRRNCV